MHPRCPRCFQTIIDGSRPFQVVVLDIRFPTLPVAELQRHQACVNALAWAPHSSCHICTAGDDSQALIWDLSSMSQSMDQGLGKPIFVCRALLMLHAKQKAFEWHRKTYLQHITKC